MADQSTRPDEGGGKPRQDPGHAERVLRRDSDHLLSEVEELREMERTKRRQPVSSPAFHDLARRIENKAREIFRAADTEEAHGRDGGDGQAVDADDRGWPAGHVGRSPDEDD